MTNRGHHFLSCGEGASGVAGWGCRLGLLVRVVGWGCWLGLPVRVADWCCRLVLSVGVVGWCCLWAVGGFLPFVRGTVALGRIPFSLSVAGRLLSSGDLPLRSIPPTALRLWAPPSNVPEVGHGSRRRQPPRFCGKIKHNSVQNGLRTQRPCKHGPRKHNHPGNTYSLPLPLSLMSKVAKL